MTPLNKQDILNKIFSNDFYKKIDTKALVKQFDISANLREAYAAKKPASPPVVLTTTVITSIPPEGISIIT